MTSFNQFLFRYPNAKEILFAVYSFRQHAPDYYVCPGCLQVFEGRHVQDHMVQCPTPPIELTVPLDFVDGKAVVPNTLYEGYKTHESRECVHYHYPKTGNIFQVAVFSVQGGWICPGCKAYFLKPKLLKMHTTSCIQPPVWLVSPEGVPRPELPHGREPYDPRNYFSRPYANIQNLRRVTDNVNDSEMACAPELPSHPEQNAEDVNMYEDPPVAMEDKGKGRESGPSYNLRTDSKRPRSSDLYLERKRRRVRSGCNPPPTFSPLTCGICSSPCPVPDFHLQTNPNLTPTECMSTRSVTPVYEDTNQEEYDSDSPAPSTSRHVEYR
ncbi:hypothetical protein BDZ94DRAFT_1310478 [Collybia nuda]|uniref:Uncharacterized protein n=1 Tax=Collybia nuda TaxID=64659 RepID=A0A9P5Y1J6_9AGAR|nr:hypothetical protein BDZ94DRAFT_1310478 [Collybia nuda]